MSLDSYEILSKGTKEWQRDASLVLRFCAFSWILEFSGKLDNMKKDKESREGSNLGGSIFCLACFFGTVLSSSVLI